MAGRGCDEGGRDVRDGGGSDSRSPRVVATSALRSARAGLAGGTAREDDGGGEDDGATEDDGASDDAGLPSFAPGRTEIGWRRVLPGTVGSIATGVGRRYMRGCSGRRLGPWLPEPWPLGPLEPGLVEPGLVERRGSRGRMVCASTAGRMPELPGSAFSYEGCSLSASTVTSGAERGWAAREVAGPAACSAVDGSPAAAPPSGLPKILVSSPTVEFLVFRFPLMRYPPPRRARATRAERGDGHRHHADVPRTWTFCAQTIMAVAPVERRFRSHWLEAALLFVAIAPSRQQAALRYQVTLEHHRQNRDRKTFSGTPPFQRETIRPSGLPKITVGRKRPRRARVTSAVQPRRIRILVRRARSPSDGGIGYRRSAE
jgi:hypothetical protein